MATSLVERLRILNQTNESLMGFVPLTQNADPNEPTINDSFEKGTYYDTLINDTSNPDSATAGRITRTPKKP
jgi:hypothetical protein